MKNLIKKILRESDEWDWVRNILNDATITKDNAKEGLRVMVNPNSRFAYQAAPNNHGTISYIYDYEFPIDNDDDDDGVDNTYWVYVEWDNGVSNSYRVGDVEYDLLLPTEEKPIKESDELDWIRTTEPTRITNNESYIMKTCDLQQFLEKVEHELPTVRWTSGEKPTRYTPLSNKVKNSEKHHIKINIYDNLITYSSIGAEDFNNAIYWP
jgi:hypothetical protein